MQSYWDMRLILPTFYVQLLCVQIPQSAKRHWWLDCLFALLVSLKAGRKHVGEIDPWYKNDDGNMHSHSEKKYFHNNEDIPVERGILEPKLYFALSITRVNLRMRPLFSLIKTWRYLPFLKEIFRKKILTLKTNKHF